LRVDVVVEVEFAQYWVNMIVKRCSIPSWRC
jgi:hypothetical protein